MIFQIKLSKTIFNETEIRGLFKLAEIYYSGFHTLISDFDTSVIKNLDSTIANALLGARRRLYQLSLYLDIVDKYIVIDDSVDEILYEKDKITMPLDVFSESSLAQKSILLLENLKDDEIYSKIANWFARKNGNITFDYEVYDGSGGELGSRLHRLASRPLRDRRFVSCIYDSDRKYSGSRAGATARGIDNGLKRVSPEDKNYISVFMLDVHECENLIPFEIIQGLNSPMESIIANAQTNGNWKYLDYKNGIELRRLKHSETIAELEFYQSVITQNGLDTDCGQGDCSSRKTCVCKSIGGWAIDPRIIVERLSDVDSLSNVELSGYWEKIGRILLTIGLATTPQAI